MEKFDLFSTRRRHYYYYYDTASFDVDDASCYNYRYKIDVFFGHVSWPKNIEIRAIVGLRLANRD